jgi:hypothetical protein
LSSKKSVLGQIDDFEQPISDSISYNYEFLIFIFLLLIIGAIIWKLTHRTKERRYFSSEVKRQIKIRITNVLYVKRILEFGIMTIKMEINQIIRCPTVKHYVLIVMLKRHVAC